MICYKDKAYCTASNDGRCVNKDCYRFFSDDDREGAEKWWEGVEGEPPIAFADFWEGCHEKIESRISG